MFDDLRDQISERASQISAQIQESTLYITIQERYDNLSPNVQKLLLAGVAAAVVLTILWIPMSFLTSAGEHYETFEGDRNLTLELVQAQSLSAATPSSPRALSAPGLVGKVNDILNRERILPEQIVSVSNSGAPPKILPKGAVSSFVEAKLSKLNLRQIVALGHQLHEMHSTTKLTDMAIEPNADNDHYFDVSYKILSFGPPDRPKPKPAAKKKNKRNRKRGRGRN